VENLGRKTVVFSGHCLVVKIIGGTLLAPSFRSIFQAGFHFCCQVGLSIEDFFFRELTLSRATVEEKVSTIFLDGQCVDNIAAATLSDGSVIALSSALPGLAGATLRRGGFYACLRDSITYQTEKRPVDRQQGIITVKLFNLLMDELGPVFLRKGITVGRSEIIDFFRRQREGFWKQVGTIILGKKTVVPHELTDERIYNNADHVTIIIDDSNRFQ